MPQVRLVQQVLRELLVSLVRLGQLAQWGLELQGLQVLLVQLVPRERRVLQAPLVQQVLPFRGQQELQERLDQRAL